MRLSTRAPIFALLAVLALGCEEEKKEPDPNAGGAWVVNVNAGAGDDRAKIFPLVGRWYPIREVKRLSDRTLTPYQWCTNPPTRIVVKVEEVTVECRTPIEGDGRRRITAPVAQVRTSTGGDTVLDFRVEKDFPLQQLRASKIKGVTGMLRGSPCKEGKDGHFQRFPEYEIFTRQILQNKRCAQIIEERRLGSK